MFDFPSREWFDAVRSEFNRNDEYHKHGAGQCNCIAGVKVGNDVFVLTFEGQECISVEIRSDEDLAETDFYMHMQQHEWVDMLKNIKDHGHAVGDYTLNTLDLDRADGLSTSIHGDQYREDMFFRFNQTLQFFFDASHSIPTKF